MNIKPVLTRLLAATLIGLAGVVSMLTLLTQGASAVSQGHTRPVVAIAETADSRIAVDKTATPGTIYADDAVTYTYRVTNPGDDSLSDVAVGDDKCAPVTGPTEVSGNGDDALDPGEVWEYTCSTTLGADTTNMTTVTGTSALSGTVTHTDTASVDVINPDITLVKTAAPTIIYAGDRVTYTYQVTNPGDDSLSDVEVSDDKCAPVTGPFEVSGNGDDALDPGEDWEYTCSTTLVTDTTNTATVTGTDSLGGTVTAQDAATVQVEPAVDLAVIKTSDPGPVIAGKSLTYTLAITNHGPSNATGVTLTDTLPAEVGFSSTAPGCAYDSIEHHVTCDRGPLVDGQTDTVVIVVTVPPSTTGALSNRAEVSGDQHERNPGNNTTTQGTDVEAEADLVVAKEALTTVDAGAQMTYTLTITNYGPSYASGVTLTDTMPAEVNFVSSSPALPTCAHLDGLVACDLGTLTVGETATAVVVVDVTSPLTNGTILTNIATVDADTADPKPEDNTAQAATTVRSAPNLSISKIDDEDPVPAGGNLHYTIAISNTGNENATGVTLVETYDANVAFDLALPAPDVGDNRWNLGVVEVGDPQRVDVVARVDSPLLVGTVLTNLVTLDSDQTDPITATEFTSVTAFSDLTVSKSDLSDPPQAGEQVMYLIVYESSGTALAEDVVITETYDSNVTFVTSTNEGQRRPGTDNVWDIGDLPPNYSGYFFVTGDVAAPLPNGTVLTNVVTIDSKYTEPRTFTETTVVESAPDLSLDVTDQPDPVRAGSSLAYTLRYGNAGNADATGVVVTATLDGNVTYDSALPAPTGGAGDVWYWDIGEIPGVDGSGQIILRANVPFSLPNGTKLNFTTQLADAQGDYLEKTVQTTVRTLPDLVIDKLGHGHDPSLFSPGEEMAYLVTYGNAGYEDAQDVVITTELPTDTAYVDAGHGWQSSGGGIYTYSVGDLPARSIAHTITFTVRHTSGEPQQISVPEFNTPFTITAGGGGEDANPGDDVISVTIGVPDLVVAHFSVEPEAGELQVDEPVVFTVVLENQGTGWAWNPKSCTGDPYDPVYNPVLCAAWFVDVFVAPIASYPFEGWGAAYAEVDPIASGAQRTVVFTHTFTEQQIGSIHEFYVKADNHSGRPYGLVPEYNEMNNLGKPLRRVYLPLVLRN